MSRSEVSQFGVEELFSFLLSELETDVSTESLSVLKRNRVNGKIFLDLEESDLKEIIPLLGERKAIKSIIDSFKVKDKVLKIVHTYKAGYFNDSVCKQVIPAATPKGPIVYGSSFLSDFEVPKKYSKRTMEAIESGELTKSVRIDIINVLALKVFQYTSNPTSEEYTSVCIRLITAYPVLKDTIGNGYVS